MFNFLGQYGTKWSYLNAFAVVTIIPVILVFLFMQRYIISGLTAGSKYLGSVAYGGTSGFRPRRRCTMCDGADSLRETAC